MGSETGGATSATFQGRASDGTSAMAHDVDVHFTVDGLVVLAKASGARATWPFAKLATNVPIGRGTRDVVVTVAGLPGVSLYVDDATFAATLAQRAPSTAIRAFRWSGLKPGLTVGAIAGVMFSLVTVLDLSPSKAVARVLPEATRTQLGNRVLATFPIRTQCRPNAAGKAALDVLAKRLLPGISDPGAKVVVLDWGLINAFAVPGGKVILTRGVIEKAGSADELAGVLAHEFGHGLELHPEAGLIRSVGISALIQWLFTGAPGTLGTAGSTFAQLAYNRAFEREADAVALRLLREATISPQGFAAFFRRVDEQRGSKGGTSSGPTRELFDTHPSTPERVRTIEAAAGYAATPALSAEQWAALQGICRPATPTGSSTSSSTPNAPGTPPADPMKQAEERIARAPQSATSWYERGELHMQARRYADAERDFARAIQIEPANAHYLYRRGAALQDAMRYADAIEAYGQVVRLNPRHAQAFAGRGAVHRILKNAREAERDLSEALSINPRQPYALYQRGLLYGELKNWPAMERDFSSVIEGNRGYAFAYVRRAEAYEGLGDKAKAIADYRAALRGAPSSANAEEAFRMARLRLTALGETP